MEQAEPTTRLSIKEALKVLTDAIIDECRKFDAIDKSDLHTYAKFFKQLTEHLDLLESQVEILQHVHDKLSHEIIPEIMESKELDSFRQSGRLFVLSVRTHANIPEDKREAGFKWLREVANVPDAIQERVNPKSLTSIVTSYFETNAEWPPEEAVTVYQKKYIAMRK